MQLRLVVSYRRLGQPSSILLDLWKWYK